MKKALIAVAAMAAGSAAFAQSSVQLYGRVNVTLENQKTNNVKTRVMNDNASRFGLRGTEDLGGGLKAGFILENRSQIDRGTVSTPFWAGQSEVNLGGGFGMVRLGRFTSEAYFATADFISFHNHDTGTSADALYAYLGRDNNKISYRTPEFIKGLTAEVGVSAPEGAAGQKRTLDAAVNYTAGALGVGLGYQNANETGRDRNQFAVRANYTFGPVTVGGYIQRDENGYASANLGDRSSFRVSAMYEMGPAELHLNVGRAGKYSNVANSEATQATVGANYNLSKRTKVYTYYTRVDDKLNAAGLYGDYSSFAVGVRHNF
jgi:predicted porin